MKVLITGGSGFLGINLIRYLLAKKGAAKIIVLDFQDFDYPEKDEIVFIKGDIRDKEVINTVFDNHEIDVVIHAAAALPLYSRRDIFTTDIDGTRNMAAASYESGVERFILISSTAVYGIPDHHPLCENDPMIGVGPYGEAKIKAEEVCLEYREKGMCLPILRPKSFIGPERLGVFALFYDWAKDGKNFPILGSGKNRYQFLDVEDLCSAIYLCMTKEKEVVNDTFNVGAKSFTTLRKDYQSVLDKAGFGKKIVTLPAKPAIWALRVLELFKLSPLYEWVYETIGEDSFVSIEKAEKKLGFAPQYSNKDTLLRNYQWYLDNLDSFKNQTGISHRVPWKQGILGLLKKIF